MKRMYVRESVARIFTRFTVVADSAFDPHLYYDVLSTQPQAIFNTASVSAIILLVTLVLAGMTDSEDTPPDVVVRRYELCRKPQPMLLCRNIHANFKCVPFRFSFDA